MINPFQMADVVNAVVRIRRGPEVDREQFVYEEGEIIYSTDRKRLFVGDGINGLGTYGGNIIGSKTWVVSSFDMLPYVARYDMVYRTDPDCGFYVLTGNQYLLPDNYVLVGGKKLINDNVIIPPAYVLPYASNSVLGGIKIGSGLVIDQGIASVKVDDNTLTISNNKLSVTEAVNDLIKKSSYTEYGKVRITSSNALDITNGNLRLLYDTSKLAINASNELTIANGAIPATQIASYTQLGNVQIVSNNGLDVTNGNLRLNYDSNSFTINGNAEFALQPSLLTPLPYASTTVYGKVRIVNNSGLDINNGNLAVKADNTTIGFDGTGALTYIGGGVGGGGTTSDATYAAKGIVRIQSGGGINVASGIISVANDNSTIKLSSVGGSTLLSVDPASLANYFAPKIATTSQLGQIKVGSGLQIDGEGVLSVTGGGGGGGSTFTIADSLGTLVGVTELTISNGLDVTSTGTLTLKTASTNNIGGVKISDGLSATNAGDLRVKCHDNNSIEIDPATKGLKVNPTYINGLVADYSPDKLAAEQGYTKLPGGIIFQWGWVENTNNNTTNDATIAVVFPLQFPNNVFFASPMGSMGTVDGGTAGTTEGAGSITSTITRTGFSISNAWYGNLSTTRRIYWLAIGN